MQTNIQVLNDLQQAKSYLFTTNKTLRTEAAPHIFRDDLQDDEALLCIEAKGTHPMDISVVWTQANGWKEDAYSELVTDLIGFIDASQDVQAEFINQSQTDGIGVLNAVNSWFSDENTPVFIAPHLCGMLDIDVSGLEPVRRVVLMQEANVDNRFNVYYASSSKCGADFNTDVLSTLRPLSKQLLTEIEAELRENTPEHSEAAFAYKIADAQKNIATLVQKNIVKSNEPLHVRHWEEVDTLAANSTRSLANNPSTPKALALLTAAGLTELVEQLETSILLGQQSQYLEDNC
jgi:hypothetical protein